MAGADRIDDRIAELACLVGGRGRVRAELLAEARDGLVDAAEGYRRAGMSAEAAERQAVREFGAAVDLAASYRAELGLVRGRRTAMMVLVVLGVQPVAWHWVIALLRGPGPSDRAVWVYRAAGVVADWAGLAGMVLAVAAVVACSLGARRFRASRWPAVWAGVLGVAVAGFFGIVGVLLTVFNPVLPILPLGLPLMVILVAAPLAVVAAGGRGCLVAVSD